MGIVPFQAGSGRGCGYVRFGSKADIRTAERYVCFTPESGHVQRTSTCLLCANSGHQVVAGIALSELRTVLNISAGLRLLFSSLRLSAAHLLDNRRLPGAVDDGLVGPIGTEPDRKRGSIRGTLFYDCE